MSWVEVLGFVSGAACVWLATRQNVWNFPVGIANNLLFLWLFAHTGLYANAGLQVVFAALAVLGWVWWVRGGADRRRARRHPDAAVGVAGRRGRGRRRHRRD